MISGNGTSKKKDADEGRRREADLMLFLRAFEPMRTTASSTIASTAALSPKNRAETMPTLP